MSLSEHVDCVAITFKMPEKAEQKICIKFYVQLECSSVENTQMIPKAFGDNMMNAVQMKVWHKHFKMADNLLKVIHILEGPQQAEHLRMLHVYGLQTTKIGN